MELKAPSKREVFDVLIKQSPSVFIHVDPKKCTSIPPWLRDKVEVVFQVGLNMAVPVLGMQTTPELFRATLSFKGVPHLVEFSWDAVFALIDETAQGLVWKKDRPAAPELPAPKAPSSIVSRIKPLADTLPRVEGKGPPRNNIVSLDGWKRAKGKGPLRRGPHGAA